MKFETHHTNDRYDATQKTDRMIDPTELFEHLAPMPDSSDEDEKPTVAKRPGRVVSAEKGVGVVKARRATGPRKMNITNKKTDDEIAAEGAVDSCPEKARRPYFIGTKKQRTFPSTSSVSMTDLICSPYLGAYGSHHLSKCQWSRQLWCRS